MSEVLVPARVNHSRWLADCPKCHNAVIVRKWRDAWRRRKCVVKCPTKEPAVCGVVLNVVWPDPGVVDLVERAMEPRPFQNRNWDQWESVDALLAENEIHREELVA